MGLFPLATTSAVALTILAVAGVLTITFTSMAQAIAQIVAPPQARGSVLGLFNTAVLGLRAGSGVTGGVLGALINIPWSLALSAAAVVVTAGVLLARERGGERPSPAAIAMSAADPCARCRAPREGGE